MKKFKPGQQVVFKDDGIHGFHQYAVIPAENEVVTIKQRSVKGGLFWRLVEFEKGTDGLPQAFNERVLFPLKEAGDALTEKLVSDLEKKIHRPIPQPLNV